VADELLERIAAGRRLRRHRFERAGFLLVAAASFLRNPADGRDWSASPAAAGKRRGTSDRFR